MSVVTLQLGQCGNQIGGQYFATLAEDLSVKPQQHETKSDTAGYTEAGWERFFHQPTDGSSSSGQETAREARAVMVDMESKVIAQTLQQAQKSGLWRYPDKAHFCQKRGSGNNWANGFCVHGPRVKDTVLNMVTREVEKCDNFGGFIALMSLAGGTGSGVGAFITECLRDDFPHSFIVNQVVWPYSMGEVIVQNYNAVLTLSHLYQCSDAVLTLENDVLQRICSRLLGIQKVSMKDINRVIAHKLASITQPAYRGHCSSERSHVLRNHIGEMLEHVVPHPEYKLLTIRSIPQMSERSLQYNTYQWHGLLKHLRQMLIADAAMEEGIDWQVTATPGSYGFNKSLANLLFLRGKDLDGVDTNPFSDPKLYPEWVPPGGACEVWSHPHSFNQYEKSASLLSNSQAPVETLDKVVGKAWSMFASRAFVHQYIKHGLTEEDFVDSFAGLEQVVASYENL